MSDRTDQNKYGEQTNRPPRPDPIRRETKRTKQAEPSLEDAAVDLAHAAMRKLKEFKKDFYKPEPKQSKNPRFPGQGPKQSPNKSGVSKSPGGW